MYKYKVIISKFMQSTLINLNNYGKILYFGTLITNHKSNISMKQFIFLIFSLFFTINPSYAQTDYSKEVAKLITNLSLEDKVGEMTQLSLDVLCVGEPYNVSEPIALDPKKLDYVLNELRVGSILNVAGHAYDRETWHKLISEIQRVSTKEKKSGIPVLYGIDGIHGMNYTIGSTLFPQQINLAATWNPAHAKVTGEVVAYEARASYIPWNFSPVLDIARDPRWPRFWETFGEDPYLSGTMGSEMIRGMQGNDLATPYTVAACMKHFIGYSLPLRGKDRTPAWIPTRHLKEYFTPSFKAAIDAGAKTVMINSGELNGIPVHANSEILIDLLRTELGFKGLAVTDWEDIIYLVTRHKVAKDHKDAIRIAINAGIDMSMVPMDTRFPILLKELVEEGLVPMSRIDEAVGRILLLKYELGLFSKQYHDQVEYDQFGGPEFQQKSYEAAVESITLLKNEKSVLPIAAGTKILVTGPTSNSLNYLNGGWTGVWQGNDEKYNTPNKLNIQQAFKEIHGNTNVTFHQGCIYDQLADDASEAYEASKTADVIFVCVGEKTYTETPGNINDINLPDAQVEFVKELAKSGKPIVLVYVGGRPRIIREMETHTTAVIAAMLPGNEGAKALVSLIQGTENFSAKLPFTYPKFANDLVCYDYKGTDRVKSDFSMNGFDPQYEFGFGLSYTDFEYSNLVIDKTEYTKNGVLNVRVDVRNTGIIAGKEVVQVYISDFVATITPPAKKLRAYEKISLNPGEKKTVSFEIPINRLAFVGVDNTWNVESGTFNLQIEKLNRDFEVK